MKNKKVILSSILSLVLCLSLIVGGTFALFTSTTQTNISINSGKVEVVAEVADLKLYSHADIDMNTEVGTKTYVTDTFLNGGTAAYAEGTLTLDKLTPGDGVEFNISVANNSNVAIKYRVLISGTTGDSKLMEGLAVTIDGKDYAGAVNGDWTDLEAAGTIPAIPVTIELPTTAGNEYQDLTVALSVAVEAVQGNAVEHIDVYDPDNAGEVTLDNVIDSAAEFVAFANAVNAGNTYAGETVTLATSIDLNNEAWTAMKSFAGTFDGQNYTVSNLTANLFDTVSGTVKNLNVENVNVLNTAKGGANGFIKTVANGGLVDNCKVSGVDIQWTGTIKDMTDGFGGVICQVQAGATVQNCEFTDISVTTYGKTKRTGGVFGGTAGTVKSCVFNDVKFTVVDKDGIDGYVTSYGGGLAAVVSGGAVVEDCVINNMQVNVDNGGHLGGIFGKAHIFGQTAPITLKDITVNGLTMKVGNNTDKISCIAGFIAQPDSRRNDVRVAIDNCHIYGLDMTLTGKPGESAAAGFISGLCGGVDVTNCSVSGKIDGTNTSANIGGFIGDAGWYGSIEQNFTNCVTNVDITVTNSIGGGFIAVDGTLSSAGVYGGTATLNFTDCQATGTVTVVDGGTGTAAEFCGKTIE